MCAGTVGYKSKWHGAEIVNYLYDQMEKYVDKNGTSTTTYGKGHHLVCMPSAGGSPKNIHVGDYGICAFPNKDHISGKDATAAVKGIKDHGCKKCGSNAGVTINYVKHICSDPSPLNKAELDPIC